MASFLVSSCDRPAESRLAHNGESVGKSASLLEASSAYDIVVHEHPEIASIGLTISRFAYGSPLLALECNDAYSPVSVQFL